LGSGPDGNRALGPHSFFGIKSPPDFLPGSPSAGLTYCPSTRLARSKLMFVCDRTASSTLRRRAVETHRRAQVLPI
jgi:hypothetical protein